MSYQDMNGIMFTSVMYKKCLHPDVTFIVDGVVFKTLCNCGNAGGTEYRECFKFAEFNLSTDIILVEHIGEYFYSGHSSVVYKDGYQQEIERALFL